MNEESQLTFRIAKEGWEFEQIHRLNYKTFVEELPQHEPSPERRLVDQFHDRNTYVVCLKGKELAGMIAICGQRRSRSTKSCPTLIRAFRPHGARANSAARRGQEISARANLLGITGTPRALRQGARLQSRRDFRKCAARETLSLSWLHALWPTVGKAPVHSSQCI